jgi:hypothetical protein
MSDDQPTAPFPPSPEGSRPVPPVPTPPAPSDGPRQGSGPYLPPAPVGPPRLEAMDITPGGDPWAVTPVEVLDASADVPPARRGRRGVVGLVSAGVAVALVAGAGLAWAAFNGDTGDQPEKHLPGTAAALVKADLNPSGSQKIDAVRFFAKFPFAKELQGDQPQDPKRFLYERLVTNTPSAPAWSEVEPWLGDRVAIGAVPVDGEPVPVAVLQVTDEAKARATFAAHTDAAQARVEQGWAVVTDSQAHLDAVTAATAKGVLAEDSTFKHDTQALGDPGVLGGWVDASRLGDGAATALTGNPLLGGATQHVAFVGRFTGGNAEVSLRSFGQEAALGKGGAGDVVAALPGDTVAAVGLTDGGANLTSAWSRLLQTSPETGQALGQAEEQSGLKLPGDLVDLLGQRFALAVGAPDASGQPVLGVRAQSTTAASSGALDRLLAATDSSGLSLERRDIDGGYVVSTSRPHAEALASGKGDLGSSAAFRDAVPDAGDAQMVAYVDVERLAATYSSFTDDAGDELKALKAIGLSASGTSDGYSMTLRVTTR